MAMAAFQARLPAFKVPAFFGRLNGHIVGAAALGLLVGGTLLAVALFGKPPVDRPLKMVAIPSTVENTHITLALRADDPVHGAAQGTHGQETLPSLPGVHDPDAPATAAHGKTHNSGHKHAQMAQKTHNPNALARAPIAGLTAPGPGGLLPIISASGQRPAQAYARAAHVQRGKPAIAVTVGGLGLKKETTLKAIENLPPAITLSFVPYTKNLQSWIDRARAAGHEVMIELPMEPFDYPHNDPGPQTLLASASAAENTRRLEWLLSRATGYFAVTNYMGSKFTASESALSPVMRQLRRRGVDFIYDGETKRSSLRNVADAERVRWVIADRIIDAEPSAEAIDNQLLHIEALALQNGTALGSAFSWPVTMDRLTEWTGTLKSNGYTLVPASAIINARLGAVQIETPAHANAKVASNTHIRKPAKHGH